MDNSYKNSIVTREYLRNHPNEIFVFGDNLIRKGKGGAAILRDEPNTYGFITKKYPNNDDSSFYRLEEYELTLADELRSLERTIEWKTDKIFLISKLGAGLANKYNIWSIIEPALRELANRYPNVKLLF